MASVSSTSEDETPVTKQKQKKALNFNQKNIILNIYQNELNKYPKKSISEIIKTISNITGVSRRSILRIQKQHSIETISFPKKIYHNILNKLNDYDKNKIRQIIHQLFYLNQLPTTENILEIVSNDASLPNFNRSTLYRLLLKDMNFKYEKIGAYSFINDKEEIVLWRRNYLRKIKEFREANKRIYYLDEMTWINEMHVKSKVLKNSKTAYSQNAYLNKQRSTNLENSDKIKQFIICHIGSENGFVEGALLIFRLEKNKKNHKEMNSTTFEKWFTIILDKLEDNSVIVMDDAPYHSRKIEETPNNYWKISDIKQWLNNKNINFYQDMVKIELLHIVEQYKSTYDITCVIDEIAKLKNIIVLRLPPYHCELNPIEIIWTEVKDYIVKKNIMFRDVDMKESFYEELFCDALNTITEKNWKNCIQLVSNNVENKFWQLDYIIQNIIESSIINSNDKNNNSESNAESNSEYS
ncbi:hypothetical protein HZH68_007345 [Vespula germanica]|uniref:Tc1-like transposase DDE domain-containing protein n=1 Tax=Vespula germanica TaxID=30212 RepID=A0A834NA66_VESGE|nr:hypothetical protein HZH68_007345 [Vespula germanica]